MGVAREEDNKPEESNKNLYRDRDTRDGVTGIILAIGLEDEEQIIRRGLHAESRVGTMETDNRFLGQAVSKLADYGNLNNDVANMLRIVAGRLILESTPRDQWREYVPDGTRVKDWSLVEHRRFGDVSRYTIFMRDKDNQDRRETKAEPVMQILMISSSGKLLERQHCTGDQAEHQYRYLCDRPNLQR